MTSSPSFPNNLAAARAAAGVDTPGELAISVGIDPAEYERIERGEMLPSSAQLRRLIRALGDVEPEALFSFGLLNTMGDVRMRADKPDYARFFNSMSSASRLLVGRRELTWMERASKPDRKVDVFVNLSCGPQESPHLNLNIVAILEKLGVSFAAGAGRQFCCGVYYRRYGHHAASDRMRMASIERGLAWGASTRVNFCTQCQNTFADATAHAAGTESPESGVRQVQVLDFIAEQLEALGDRVPWQRPVATRVLIHGHTSYSPIHDLAKHNAARVLRLVPGVEVVGFIEQTFADSFCDTEPGVPRLAWPATSQEMSDRRAELAAIARRHGADTVSCQHHRCHQSWSTFSSDELAVRHCVSIVAEALGCEYPDRHQAALRVGHPEAVVEQTRPIWRSWGLTETEALEIARASFHPLSAMTPTVCACGGGPCRENLIPVDGVVSDTFAHV